VKIVWSDPAKADIHSIADHIAKDSLINAKRFIAKLKEQAGNIVLFPRKHRAVPEFRNDDIREVLVGNYRIIFQIISDQVISIQAVVHGSRDLSSPANQPWEIH
jgi:toxin ParE1/3/4